MREPVNRAALHYVEGPARYSSADVAAAFSTALAKPVKALCTPRDQWISSFRSLGFSDVAANSYARMTALTLESEFPPATDAQRGTTTLQAYINELVERSGQPS
jgi:hypothetical protein